MLVRFGCASPHSSCFTGIDIDHSHVAPLDLRPLKHTSFCLGRKPDSITNQTYPRLEGARTHSVRNSTVQELCFGIKVHCKSSLLQLNPLTYTPHGRDWNLHWNPQFILAPDPLTLHEIYSHLRTVGFLQMPGSSRNDPATLGIYEVEVAAWKQFHRFQSCYTF